MINGFMLHDTTSAAPASADILNGVQKAWGFVRNLHRVLAESPAALEAYSTLWGIAEKTSFTSQERNIAYLAIIYENECTYCMAGHTNLSRMVRVDDGAIAAVREGRPIADPKLEALRLSQRKSRGSAASWARPTSPPSNRLDTTTAQCRRACSWRDQAHLQLHESSRADAE